MPGVYWGILGQYQAGWQENGTLTEIAGAAGEIAGAAGKIAGAAGEIVCLSENFQCKIKSCEFKSLSLFVFVFYNYSCWQTEIYGKLCS